MAYMLEKIGAKAERKTAPCDFATLADVIEAIASKGFRFQALINTGYTGGTVVDPVSGKQMKEEGGFAYILARGGGKQLRRLKGSTGSNLIGIVTDELRANIAAIEKDL